MTDSELAYRTIASTRTWSGEADLPLEGATTMIEPLAGSVAK